MAVDCPVIDLTQDEPSQTGETGDEHEAPVIPSKIEQEIAMFAEAICKACPNLDEHDLDVIMEEAHLHDDDVLPGGVVFQSTVAITSSFMKASGIKTRNESHDRSSYVPNELRDQVVCGVCETPRSFLMDPFFSSKTDSSHTHKNAVCIDCAVNFVNNIAAKRLPEDLCPLCVGDRDIYRNAPDCISDMPFFTYSPEKSLMAAVYRTML
eukprot:jgi/Mesvir1/1544/Mv14527-RA.1